MQNMSCIFASNHGSQNTEERRNPHGVGRRLSKLARLWAPGPTRLFVALWSTCSFQTANLRTARSTYLLKDQGNSANTLIFYLVSSAGVRWQKWLAQRSHWSGRNVWSSSCTSNFDWYSCSICFQLVANITASGRTTNRIFNCIKQDWKKQCIEKNG